MTTIELNKPLKRGEKTIKSLEIREPSAGELRGIKLLDVAQMDASAYAELLPRISTPAITAQEFNQMAMSDLMQVMTTVAGMFEGKPSENA